jgi:hypothetical protein
MEEYENLYEKIREILGGEPGSLKVMEQQIDMDVQVEYYECSRRQKEDLDVDWTIDRARYLDEPGYSDEVKKEILASLASIDQVICYRILETFLSRAPDSLKDWTLLALNESRMLLESRIMQENQVFISTGLGGKEDKLRYFVVLVTRSDLHLSEVQQKVISNEFDFILKKYSGSLENVEFSGNIAALLVLLPMEHTLKAVFQEAIQECNKYGDFLKDDFIVTNVKTLSFEEIRTYLDRNRGD